MNIPAPQDSTLISEEGIDVLAAHCGAGEAVAAWTAKAMGGGVKFEDALAARLALIEPSRADVEELYVVVRRGEKGAWCAALPACDMPPRPAG